MNNGWQIADTITTIVGVLLAIFTIIYAARQLREAKRTRNAILIIDLHQKLRSIDSRQTVKEIYNLQDMTQISPDLRGRIEPILDNHELVGQLVANKLVDEEFSLKLIRAQPLRCWYKLEKFIFQIREEQGHYARFMEDYVIRIIKYQIKSVPKNQWTKLNNINLIEYYRNDIEKGRWKDWETPK